MDEGSVKEAIATAFAYSFLHDDWVTPLEEGLNGVDYDLALWRLKPGFKCIWEIVLHLAVWNEDIVIRTQSGEKHHPAEGAWPPIQSECPADWESAKGRLWESIGAVRKLIDDNDLDGLARGPYGLGDLLCRFIHLGYHIGQITKIKEFAG